MHGTYRRTSSLNSRRIEELGIKDQPNLRLEICELTDLGSMMNLIGPLRPEETSKEALNKSPPSLS